jgi:hypothetical protein
MRSKDLTQARPLAAGMAFRLVTSCAVAPMKGYSGSDLPASDTAIIESGPNITIEKCDGIRLGFSRLDVIVLPGNHTIEISSITRPEGDMYFYSLAQDSIPSVRCVLSPTQDKGVCSFARVATRPVKDRGQSAVGKNTAEARSE